MTKADSFTKCVLVVLPAVTKDYLLKNDVSDDEDEKIVHAHAKSIRKVTLYIGLPSTTLITDAVGVMELSWKPASSKRNLYSSSVRSMPPGNVSITLR